MGHHARSLRLSMLTAALVFVSAFVHVTAQSGTGSQTRTGPQRSAACPLTDAQTTKSVDAFAKIADFLTSEPRCVNCHGGVNPFIKGTGLDAGDDPNDPTPASKVAHGGGLIVRQREKAADGTLLMEGECLDCHNNMVPRRDGSKSRWTMAPNFLSFVDKDATTLCRQIKRSTGTADHFLGHLRDDNGGNAFGPTAFKGDRGLDPDRFDDIQPEPPSISHAALMQLAQNWVTAMGGSFKGDESCGCEFKHAKWSGQIHYTVDGQGEQHSAQQDWTDRHFSQITFTFKDGVGTVTSHAEVSGHQEDRRPIANNGSVSLIKEGSADNQGSGSRTSPAMVEVVFHPNGEYSIEPAAPGALSVGTRRTVSCRYASNTAADCSTRDNLPLYADMWQIQNEPGGKTSDPNHVQGSKTERRDSVRGGSKVGVTSQTLTWDLWRSN